MTNGADASTNGHAPFLTAEDEIGLAVSQALQTDDSVPDDLEVRSDASAVLQSSMEPLRRPALIVAGVVGLVLVVIIGGGLIGRAMKHSRS